MKKIEKMLIDWPYSIIKDKDLERDLRVTDDARYALIKRALKDGVLIRLRRGLYLIAAKIAGKPVNELALSLYLYEPSFVSLETALSFYGWIPEAVYTTTSVSPRRAQEFNTSLGIFSYKRVPEKVFYCGVERIESSTGTSLIALPWRALADYVYVYAKTWENLAALEDDLRIDRSNIEKSSIQVLKDLVRCYPSLRVRKQLKIFLEELKGKIV